MAPSSSLTSSSSSASSSRIRSRFLRSVGIVRPLPINTAPTRGVATVSSTSAKRVFRRVRPEEAASQMEQNKNIAAGNGQAEPPIKSIRGSSSSDDGTASTCSAASSLSSSSRGRSQTPPPPAPTATPPSTPPCEPPKQQQQQPQHQQRRVTFSPTSTCRPIPSRAHYSSRVRSALWPSPHELRTAVERNATEFASEGWSSEGVLEERDMYRDVRTGEYVHPVHLQWLCHETSTQTLAALQQRQRNVGMPTTMAATSRHRENFLNRSRARAARNYSEL